MRVSEVSSSGKCWAIVTSVLVILFISGNTPLIVVVRYLLPTRPKVLNRLLLFALASAKRHMRRQRALRLRLTIN